MSIVFILFLHLCEISSGGFVFETDVLAVQTNYYMMLI